MTHYHPLNSQEFRPRMNEIIYLHQKQDKHNDKIENVEWEFDYVHNKHHEVSRSILDVMQRDVSTNMIQSRKDAHRNKVLTNKLSRFRQLRSSL